MPKGSAATLSAKMKSTDKFSPACGSVLPKCRTERSSDLRWSSICFQIRSLTFIC